MPDGHGFGHAKFMAMDQGGDAVARHEPVFVSGWLLGSTVIACFVYLLFWGTVRRPEGETPDKSAWRGLRTAAFVLCGLIYEAVFAMLCWSYWRSLTETDVHLHWAVSRQPVVVAVRHLVDSLSLHRALCGFLRSLGDAPPERRRLCRSGRASRQVGRGPALTLTWKTIAR